VGELGDVAAGDSGCGPVELHPQPLGQGPVVEVLPVPVAARREPADRAGEQHLAEQREQQEAVRSDVGVGNVGDADQQNEHVRGAQRAAW